MITQKVEELRENFKLIDFYIDDGYTGLNTDRPLIQRMITDCEKGLIKSNYAMKGHKVVLELPKPKQI